jgi:hypothetical protein
MLPFPEPSLDLRPLLCRIVLYAEPQWTAQATGTDFGTALVLMQVRQINIRSTTITAGPLAHVSEGGRTNHLPQCITTHLFVVYSGAASPVPGTFPNHVPVQSTEDKQNSNTPGAPDIGDWGVQCSPSLLSSL